ncbi:hypothetical protein MHU86_23300 [Fragilaria crotonensis]|nr:hypothetical protein MHU86_23300 [Fragilaria crotonensis]
MTISFSAAFILFSFPVITAMGSNGSGRHANSNPAGPRGGQEGRTTASHPRTVGAMNGMSRHRESNSVRWATGAAMMQETERTSGTCGDGNMGNGLCPTAGQCCSTYGWCGVGPEYCTGTTVPATSHFHTSCIRAPCCTSWCLSSQCRPSPVNDVSSCSSR